MCGGSGKSRLLLRVHRRRSCTHVQNGGKSDGSGLDGTPDSGDGTAEYESDGHQRVHPAQISGIVSAEPYQRRVFRGAKLQSARKRLLPGTSHR